VLLRRQEPCETVAAVKAKSELGRRKVMGLGSAVEGRQQEDKGRSGWRT